MGNGCFLSSFWAVIVLCWRCFSRYINVWWGGWIELPVCCSIMQRTSAPFLMVQKVLNGQTLSSFKQRISWPERYLPVPAQQREVRQAQQEERLQRRIVGDWEQPKSWAHCTQGTSSSSVSPPNPPDVGLRLGLTVTQILPYLPVFDSFIVSALVFFLI